MLSIILGQTQPDSLCARLGHENPQSANGARESLRTVTERSSLLERYLDTISRAVERGENKLVTKVVKDALAHHVSPLNILQKGLVPGIQELGKRFRDGQAYLPEVLISCRAMDSGVEELKSYLVDTDMHNKGMVVLGTVEGDLHDIGKNLVKLMLKCNGFSVKDLGVDVSADSFVKAARTHCAHIVGISALLTLTMTSMPKVMEALEKAGLRDKVKVMIGGAPITRGFANDIGAEGFAEDCASAVEEALRLRRLQQ